jgi:hypothetical protein
MTSHFAPGPSGARTLARRVDTRVDAQYSGAKKRREKSRRCTQECAMSLTLLRNAPGTGAAQPGTLDNPGPVPQFSSISMPVRGQVNTVEKTADRLKPVAQERHRLKSVVRALAGFSARAREPRAIGPRLIACRPQKTMVCPTAGGLAASERVEVSGIAQKCVRHSFPCEVILALVRSASSHSHSAPVNPNPDKATSSCPRIKKPKLP